MASILCLYSIPGYRQFALMAMMLLFKRHDEQDCWEALQEFNKDE